MKGVGKLKSAMQCDPLRPVGIVTTTIGATKDRLAGVFFLDALWSVHIRQKCHFIVESLSRGALAHDTTYCT
jgi:hypothetical protein